MAPNGNSLVWAGVLKLRKEGNFDGEIQHEELRGEMERDVGHSREMLDFWVRRSTKWGDWRTKCRRL